MIRISKEAWFLWYFPCWSLGLDVDWDAAVGLYRWSRNGREDPWQCYRRLSAWNYWQICMKYVYVWWWAWKYLQCKPKAFLFPKRCTCSRHPPSTPKCPSWSSRTIRCSRSGYGVLLWAISHLRSSLSLLLCSISHRTKSRSSTLSSPKACSIYPSLFLYIPNHSIKRSTYYPALRSHSTIAKYLPFSLCIP